MKILITGSSGFIGKALTISLNNQSTHEIITTTRSSKESGFEDIQAIAIGNILPTTDWSKALRGVECIIHLAGRAHILNEAESDPLTEFRKINTAGTVNLAHQAAKLNIKRFIFISSIGVNGNQTTTRSFTVDDASNPVEPYAVSKHEAEIGLRQIATETGMEVVIIRPPLVYDANAPGNFGRLIHTVARGIPLPLGAIHNQRSFVALDNLVDLITVCIDHPAATNQTFLVSDDEDISTTELLKRVANALKKPARLIPIPASIITLGATLFGKRDLAQRLCGSLQVDISHTKKALDWKPPVSVDVALQKTADAFLIDLKKKS